MKTNIPFNTQIYGKSFIELGKLFYWIMEYLKLSSDLKKYADNIFPE